MVPENARNEKIEFLDINAVTGADEIVAVEFKCRCGRELKTISIRENGVDGKVTAAICEMQCPRCGEYSGFNFLNVERDKSYKPEQQTDRQARQKNLCDLLTRNLKHPTEETRWMLHTLMEGRNLELRFGVKRVD